MSELQDKIRELEDQFPSTSGATFKEAQLKALKAGHSVVVVRGKNLVRLYPDGKIRKIKTLQGRRKVLISRKELVEKVLE